MSDRLVNVLLFGPEARALGAGGARVRLGAGGNCGQLKDALGREHPALAPFLRTARFAVNSEFVPPDYVVREGDEIALIGMVSGG